MSKQPIRKKHAIHRLHDYRKSLSSRPFRSRGCSVVRCDYCRLAADFCTCASLPDTDSDASFVLLMYDDEVLKPSNTARLIADLVPDTHAFLWRRTEVDPALIALLQQPQWQPFVVFPGHYAEPERPVHELLPSLAKGKRPLFIMLDGSWREACKMFRKSPYLDGYPLLSFSPEQASGYQIRKAAHSNQLATAEVAARVLAAAGEPHNAQLMQLWFELFSYRYQQAVHQINQGREDALERLDEYINSMESL
ncbi:tRNA-uridine aminocarboxypropyltransferase [Corallincola luteus]|uniref:tRNA-uridine aminocarboxypropyltransferase n=1 Tax=Corallincola luteus TaxID=1775177 RepID=UPI001F0DDCA0|nr:tRNA-uridine aminocarboxypropyltransferase [Corallincola luteus]